MDIVMISSGKRPELLQQSLDTFVAHSVQKHNFVFVADGWMPPYQIAGSTVISAPKVGASAARNIGASSIPKYRRQNILTFLDDDVYLCPGWDEKVLDLMLYTKGVVSGHAHPFNQPVSMFKSYSITNVLSTVHISMPWSVWDEVGFFSEPGGKGGSEDVDWCKRCTRDALYVTAPQCVIHCGISGIVGEDLMKGQNEFLVNHYKLKGVKFA